MAELELSVSEFRQKFKAFSNTEVYDDDFLQTMLETAQLYISPKINKFVSTGQQKQMIYLLTAHLAVINKRLEAGDDGAGGVISNAHIEDVSVGIAVPESKNEFSYFLNSTGYGRQLLALLSLVSAVGIYVGGQKENVFR